MNTSQKSDKAGRGTSAHCWRCAQRGGDLCTLKQETNRNRRRAEPAIVEEQLLDIYGPDPGVEAAPHDDTFVIDASGCSLCGDYGSFNCPAHAAATRTRIIQDFGSLEAFDAWATSGWGEHAK